MNAIQKEIFEKCVRTGEHILTEKRFKLAFPKGQLAVDTFLLECIRKPQGISLSFKEPRTFRISNYTNCSLRLHYSRNGCKEGYAEAIPLEPA